MLAICHLLILQKQEVLADPLDGETKVSCHLAYASPASTSPHPNACLFSPKYFETSAKPESNSFFVHTHTWPVKQILILKSLQALCSQTFFIQSTAGIPSLGLILDLSRADKKCCQETNGFRGDKQFSCHCV